jgi:ankyrin repeat protein
MLLRKGADCSNSTSLLRAAVGSDSKTIVDFLLDHFSEAGLLAVNMADNWGEYLEIAAKSGKVQVLNMVLKSCIDTSTYRYEEHVINAMEAATECNEYGVLGRLLMTGVNPDTDGRACRILSKAIRRPLADENDTSCFTLLMSKFTALGLDLDKPLPGDETPFWTAILAGDAVAAQCLIFSGIDVNTPSFCDDEDDKMRNVRFERPMAQAIYQDECIHSRDYSTCHSSDFECACWVEFLLTNGANVDCLVDKSKTALLLALKSRGYEAAETLLEHGANPNARDSETGMDAFDIIYRNKFWPPFSTFKSLVDYGYQVNAKSDNGILIQLVAKAHRDSSYEYYEGWEIAALVVPLLLDSGAAVNTCATEEHPMTALQYAIDGNRKELTNILLAAGADIHAPAFW